MKLVLLEAAILLAMASLFVIAIMANPDREGWVLSYDIERIKH